jgi:uncharacterized protein DUF1579
MLDRPTPPSALTIGRRSVLAAAGAGLLVGLAPRGLRAQTASASPADRLPPFVRRGLPGAFHEALKPLEGTWVVDKRVYIAIGTRDHPALSRGMTCRRRWFGGGRHLEDITEGELGDDSYYRLGVLGFSTMDHWYEWVTFDALNANAMVYHSPPMDAPPRKIALSGVFTDQGLLGEAHAGRSIPMRTTIEILGPDRHVIDLSFMPPGEPEVLIDHCIYTRA